MPRVNNNKKIVQLIFAVIVLAVSGFVIYKNFIGNNQQPFNSFDNTMLKQEGRNSFEKAIKILEDAKFKNLIKFGNWPVVPGEKGRANPFIKL
jgi:hypothetical protein